MRNQSCEDCGSSEGVETVLDPMAYEVWDEEVPVDLCDPCHGDRADSV